jgi:hypothetical protein
MVPARSNPFGDNVFAYQVIFRQVDASSNSASPLAAMESFRAAAASGKLDNFTVAVKIGGEIIFDRSRSTRVPEADPPQSPAFPSWGIALVAVVALMAFVTYALCRKDRELWNRIALFFVAATPTSSNIEIHKAPQNAVLNSFHAPTYDGLPNAVVSRTRSGDTAIDVAPTAAHYPHAVYSSEPRIAADV